MNAATSSRAHGTPVEVAVPNLTAVHDVLAILRAGGCIQVVTNRRDGRNINALIDTDGAIVPAAELALAACMRGCRVRHQCVVRETGDVIRQWALPPTAQVVA